MGDLVLGGWNANYFATAHSGFPVTISARPAQRGEIAGERVGAVAVSTWPKAEAAALLTFIRGL